MNSASPSPAWQAHLLANRRQNRQVHLWQIALLLGLLALWELSCRMGLSDGFLTSCPSRMAATFASLRPQRRSVAAYRGILRRKRSSASSSGTATGTVVATCMWWSGSWPTILTLPGGAQRPAENGPGPHFHCVDGGRSGGHHRHDPWPFSLIVTILNMYQGFLSTDGRRSASCAP